MVNMNRTIIILLFRKKSIPDYNVTVSLKSRKITENNLRSSLDSINFAIDFRCIEHK